MKRDYFISVALASFNGEKYIKEQLESILVQLNENDEVIISDDGSTDNTLSIIKNFNDNRIKIIEGPKMGVKQNFANAINHSNGKYIFLSDQDDIWEPSKVEKVLNTFDKTDCSCVIHDNIVFESGTNNILYNSFFKLRNSKKGIIRNIIRNSYIGCCMAIREDMKKYILPIPNNIEMHDQWIGIQCEKHGEVVFINDKLIRYRRHSNNVSELKHHSLFKMIKNRIIFLVEYWRVK